MTEHRTFNKEHSTSNVAGGVQRAYAASKESKDFRQAFDDQLLHHLQTGMEIELTQKQMQELTDRIWYTTSLLKHTFTGGVGQWLKMVLQVTEKYVLVELKDYQPKPKRDILDNPKNGHMRNNWGVPSHREAMLKRQRD